MASPLQPTRFVVKPRLRNAASLAIAVTLIYLVARQIDVGLTAKWIATANREKLALAFLLMIVAYAGRAVRWLVWDSCLGFRDSVKAVLVGSMGNNLLPARLGEVLRADWIASRPQQVKFGRTAALASIAAERVLDGVVLSVFGIVGVMLIEVSPLVFRAVVAVAALFGVLGILLTASVAREASLRGLVNRFSAFFPAHLTRYARSKVHYAIDGVVRLGSPIRGSVAVAATVGIWLLELACYWTIAQAIFPVSVPIAAIFVTVVNFASLFPATIGGIGAIEGAATAFLVSVGVPAEQALAMVVIQHGMQLGLTISTGTFVYFTDRTVASTVNREAIAVDPNQEDVLERTRTMLAALAANVSVEPPDDQLKSLSIVIPAYNERQRLPKTVLETIRWCHVHELSYEIIIVDDGSADDTLSIAELLGHHDRNVRTIACPHKGKGNAVRMGMLNARGQYVLFMDADGATPLSEIPRLLMAVESGHDVAIGSRVLQLPGEVTVRTSLHRKIIGRVFAFFVNVFAVSGIADTQCGFKMFRREIVRSVFSRQKLDGFAFDVELLYIARQLDLSIIEIPVNWQNQEGSKVNLVSDSIKMLRDLTQIRWIHREMAGVHPVRTPRSPERAR